MISAAGREALRAYQKDLLRRVRKVRCPTCWVGLGKPCWHQGKSRTWCHYQRRNEAKRRGFVKGRRRL